MATRSKRSAGGSPLLPTKLSKVAANESTVAAKVKKGENAHRYIQQ